VCVQGKEHATAIGTIEVGRDGDVQVVSLRGEHDISTAPDLRGALGRARDAGHAVVVDLTDVEFVDSTVLQALLQGRDPAEEGADHRLVLVVPEDGVARRLLTLTNLDTLIPTYPTRADALASLAG
jgi:anti-sigma B factor antagonist